MSFLATLLKNKFLPPFFLILISSLFFYSIFVYGLLPIPSDFPLGVYYPWLDYHWNGMHAVPVKNPLLADVPSLIFPLKFYAMDLFKSGIIPLWNPLAFGGYPLAANFQSAVFYPLNILFLLDSSIAWSLQIMLQPILASIFTYLLLRHLKISKFASVFGAICYAFAGFNMIWLEYNIHGHVAAFIPLLIYTIDKFIFSRKIIFGILFSIVICLQILAGYPQLTLYSLILIFSWLFFRLGKRLVLSEGIYIWVKIFIFLSLGLGLAAIQLLPGIELVLFSQRVAEGLDPTLKYLPPEQLINFFIPDFFGNPTTYNYWGKGDYTNLVGYSGVIPLSVAFISLIHFRKNSLVRFFAIVAIVTLSLCIYTPVSDFFHTKLLPGLGAAKATRMLVIFNLAISVLAAIGIDILIKGENIKKIYRSLYLSLAVIISLWISTLGIRFLLNDFYGLYSKNYDVNFLIKEISNLDVAVRNLILPTLLLLMFFTLIYVSQLKIKKLFFLKKIAIFGILLLCIFELFRFGWKYNPFTPKEYIFPETPVLSFLKNQQQPFRINGGDVIPIAMWISYKLESLAGYDAIYPGRISRLISVLNTNDPKAEQTGRFGNINNYDNGIFDLTNHKYLMSLKFDEHGIVSSSGKASYKFDNPKFLPVFTDKSVAIFENKKSLPRAFFVTDWIVEKDEDKIIANLFDKNFSLDKKIIIEEEFNDFYPTLENESSLSYIDYGVDKSVINVTTKNSGLLFISDTYYPGWKAKVDEMEVKILKADYSFRAIPVQSGEHKVEMYYQPNSFKYGLVISLLSLVIIIFGGIFYARSQKFN